METKNVLKSQFQSAIRVIRDGGLVIAPTETFYGILCDAWSQKAVKSLVQLKERDFGKPIPLIAGDARIASTAVGEIPNSFKPLSEKFWPGPLTLVMKAARGFPIGITAGTESIGIRVPSQSPALDLAKFYRGPLTATSANFSGRPPARHLKEIDEELVRSVDMVIDGGWTPGTQPSTVLNLIPNPPVIIREGLLGKEVKGFLNEKGWGKDGWR
jgi:L-threonylcarbamoyladenylate synthase